MTAAGFVQAINTYIINPLIGLLFAAALVLFMWGGFQFVIGTGTEESRESGKRHLLWGIIGMFIMVSVYGILNILTGTFGITPVTPYFR